MAPADVSDVLDETTLDAIELLTPLGPIVHQRLFGTWGLYLDDRVFGLVHDGTIYFRTNEDTLTRFLDAGSSAFRFVGSDGHAIETPYFEVPRDVLEDRDEACAWAYRAAVAPV